MSNNSFQWNEISTDFRSAVAILPNNLRVPCVECRGCTLRILNPNGIRIAEHRKACPNRHHFKYIYPVNEGDRLRIKCLLCSEIINSSAMAVLLCHRQKCLPPQPNLPEVSSEPEIYYLSTDELFNSGQVNNEMNEPNLNANANVSTQMEVTNEVIAAEDSNESIATVATSSTQPKSNNTIKATHSNGNISIKRTWDTEAGSFDFKIIRVRDGNGIMKRWMQCLICTRIIKTVGGARIKAHRNVCSRKMLVTTTTTPHNRDADKNNGEIQDVKPCFICDSLVHIRSNSDRRDHVNLYNTNTTYSDTPIYDLVWKFMGEKASIRNLTASVTEWNLVCLNCFQNIEDYDFANTEAHRLEKVMMDKLSSTEKAYEQRNTVDEQNNVEENVETTDEDTEITEMTEMTETDDDVEIIEADKIVEFIISDDEYEESKESTQPQQITDQTPQMADQSLRPAQKENDDSEIIELNSDDSESEKGNPDEMELMELYFPEPLTGSSERELTFNEL